MINELKNRRTDLYRILISGVLLLAAVFLPTEGLLRLALFLLPFLLVGWDVLKEAAQNILHGEIFDENFLMCIASIGALALGDYAEAVSVMLFYQVGELFEDCAVDSSRRSIAALTDIRPDRARVLRSGTPAETAPEDVRVGERILIRPGERIPLDCIVQEGMSSLDTSALTGEPAPRDIAPGDVILSGCINLSGDITAEVTKPSSESTVTRIMALVEDAAARKARSEDFITRFAKYYTPSVVIAAVLLALVPGVITRQWGTWFHRALIFLVISCPCALVISVPLSFFGGIGCASSHGILVKGGTYLEQLAKTGIVVFDKTGTLTEGRFTVSAIHPVPGISGDELLQTAAAAEIHSPHPIARSLSEKCLLSPDTGEITCSQEHPGLGVSSVWNGVPIAAGNALFMQSLGLSPAPVPETDTVVHAMRDGKYLGFILLSDTPKPTAKSAVAQLRTRGIRTVILTGDRETAAARIGAELGTDAVFSELLPEDKVKCLEKLLDEKQDGKILVYAGDGINDAPVLCRADIGIAMGAAGSDAAIESADIVLMDDDPSKLITAVNISKKCLRIVRENILFTLIVKAAFLLLGALGIASVWGAVFADVGVALIAVFNAGRMLKKNP